MTSLPRQGLQLALLWLAQAALSLIAQPVLNSHLSATERGQLALCVTVYALAFDLLRPGITPATIYRVAAGNSYWRVVMTDNIWSFGILPFIAAIALLLPFATARNPTPIPRDLALVALLLPLGRATAGTTAGLSGAGRYGTIALSGVGGAIALLLGRYLLVPSFGVAGALYAEVIAILAMSIPLVVLSARAFPFSLPGVEDFRNSWNYGRGAFGSQVGNVIIERGLPLVLYPSLGASLAGTYVAVAIVPQSLVAIVLAVVRPLFTASARMDKDAAKHIVPLLSRLGFTTGLLLTGLVILLSGTILRALKADNYAYATSVLCLLSTQLAFRTSTAVLASHLSGSGAPGSESFATILGGTFGLLLALVGGLSGDPFKTFGLYVFGSVLQWMLITVKYRKLHRHEDRVSGLCFLTLRDLQLLWHQARRTSR